MIERHPFARWATNFMLIVSLIAGGYFVHWETAREAKVRAVQLASEAKTRAEQLASETHQRCLEAQANRSALRGIILRGRDVGKPGTPGYAYYKQHPEEAKQALKRVDRALADLPPITCN